MNIGGGDLGKVAAILPALAVTFVLWGPLISFAALLGVVGSATAAIATASTVTVTRRFRPDAVLES